MFIEVLDISGNDLNDMESAGLLRGILRSNKTMATLCSSGNEFGRRVPAADCIAEGLGSNSTILKIDLTRCDLEDGDVSILAQTLGAWSTTLPKLTLAENFITSTVI
jgi:hypothetical protein